MQSPSQKPLPELRCVTLPAKKSVVVTDLVERMGHDGQHPDLVIAPVREATEALGKRRKKCAAGHTYSDKRGVYIITDSAGYIIYIGETASRFIPYLRAKLGLGEGCYGGQGDSVSHGTYWMRHVLLLDRQNPRVAAGLACLRQGGFRVFLIPIEIKVPQAKLAERRAFRALESRLLGYHEEMSGYRPALNYGGCDVVTGNSMRYRSRLPRKVSDYLRRCTRRQKAELQSPGASPGFRGGSGLHVSP
jgi:hypothetical protein